MSFFHTDANGSVRLITDAAGQQLETFDYLPFGIDASSSSGTNHIRFSGKERDAQTASSGWGPLDYFGARYYQSQTGRFTNVDPGHVGGDILNPRSWNGYAYALNNPLRFVDPLGTCSQDAKGNYVDGDDAGTLVSPGPCPRGKDGALAIGVTETVSVKSKPAIVALAEGISAGAGPVAEPLFIAAFYGVSALGGAGVAALGGASASGAATLGLGGYVPFSLTAT